MPLSLNLASVLTFLPLKRSFFFASVEELALLTGCEDDEDDENELDEVVGRVSRRLNLLCLFENEDAPRDCEDAPDRFGLRSRFDEKELCESARSRLTVAATLPRWTKVVVSVASARDAAVASSSHVKKCCSCSEAVGLNSAHVRTISACNAGRILLNTCSNTVRSSLL